MRKLAILLGLSLSPSFGQNGVISTVAGNGTMGTAGVGGPAVNASLTGGAVCVDSSDNFYLADRGNNRVLKVDSATGILTLVAGNGVAASAGDYGPAVLSQTVAKLATSTTVSANPSSIVFGQSVVLTASVSPASGTGTVQFQDGATELGTATLNGGSASMNAAGLAVGPHAIVAVYRGDANSNTSSSAAASVTVAKGNAGVTLGSSLNPSAAGQAVIFTASVAPSAGPGASSLRITRRYSVP